MEKEIEKKEQVTDQIDKIDDPNAPHMNVVAEI